MPIKGQVSLFIRAERLKDDTCPELVEGGHLGLETVACEVGGRISHRAQALLDICATARVRSAPTHRQKYMAKWWQNRWMTMLAVGIQTCVASTLVDDGCSLLDVFDGPQPYEKEFESREPVVGMDGPSSEGGA